jgi:hypothetical protein
MSPGALWIGGWVDLRAGLGTEATGIMLFPTGDRTPIHYTDWSVPDLSSQTCIGLYETPGMYHRYKFVEANCDTNVAWSPRIVKVSIERLSICENRRECDGGVLCWLMRQRTRCRVPQWRREMECYKTELLLHLEVSVAKWCPSRKLVNHPRVTSE